MPPLKQKNITKIYLKSIPEFKINCKYCGKEYTGKRRTRQFCSKLCISRNFNPSKGKKGENRQCAFCLKDVYVMPHRKNRKEIFCNQEHFILYLKKKSFNFPCAICSKKIFTQPSQLRLRARSTCSKICRSKLARKRAESKRTGYTKHQLDRLARYSPEAQNWRINVFKQDNYTCQMCKVRGTYLEADHIKPFAYFPELRFELSNGRTLCKLCHNKTKIGYKKLRALHNTS